jgi:hypothetical protein
MSLGLRLSLLPFVLAGCAAEALVVPEADWAGVPTAQRTSVDRKSDADLTAARAEIAAASRSLDELQRAQPRLAAQAAAAPTPAAPPPAAGDPWASAIHDRDRARASGLARIDAAHTAWLRADLTWRQRRLAAANERVAVVTSQRELSRGQTIDHNLLGTETYETAPLRGQFSQAQRRWYAANVAALKARSDLEHASAEIASAKEAYAQFMRTIPGSAAVAAAELVTGDDWPPPPLVLPGWAVTRSDIRRRRGLRHFLDDAATYSPQLRKATVQLSPTPRFPPTASASLASAASASSASASIAAPAASPSPAAPAPTAATKQPAASAPTAAAKQPAASAPTAATKQPAPSTASSAKPWDAAELSAGPPIVGTATTKPVSARPAPAAKPAARPAPGPTSAKPVEAPL